MMKSKLILLFASMLMLIAFITVYAAGDGSSSGATGTDQGTTGYDQGTTGSDQGTTGYDQGTTGSDQGTYDSSDQGTIEDQETTEFQEQETLEGRDQGTIDTQERDSDILRENGDSQFQDRDTGLENGSMDRLSKGAEYQSGQAGQNGMTGKDTGSTESVEALRKAGVSEEKIQQWQGVFNAPIYTNSPGFLLGLKDYLSLTSDQQQRLRTLNEQNRTQAQQILMQEQRSKLSKLPTQQFTFHELHQEACRKMQSKMRQQKSRGQTCDMMCPLCPSKSQNGSSGTQQQQQNGSSDIQQQQNGSTQFLGSESKQQNGSTEQKSWNAGKNGMTGKDKGSMDAERKLRKHGISDDKIQQWQGIMHTPIYTNSPGFLLGLKEHLNLTSDQQQQLQTLNEQSRTQAQQILTQEQRDKLAKLPTQQFTFSDLHREVCRKIQSSQQQKSQGKGCDMTCPMCPEQSQQRNGSSDIMEQPTTQPYQQ